MSKKVTALERNSCYRKSMLQMDIRNDFVAKVVIRTAPVSNIYTFNNREIKFYNLFKNLLSTVMHHVTMRISSEICR